MKYKRRPQDDYPSPPWVIEPLLEQYPTCIARHVWEPAAGKKRMLVKELRKRGFVVKATDIVDSRPVDFLNSNLDMFGYDIVTNPPYSIPLVDDFIRHALVLTQFSRSRVAMLLRVEFDCAKSRRWMFQDHPAFRMKIVLHRRLLIPGFVHTASPAKHHAWYVWDWSLASTVAGHEIRYA